MKGSAQGETRTKGGGGKDGPMLSGIISYVVPGAYMSLASAPQVTAAELTAWTLAPDLDRGEEVQPEGRSREQ